MSLTIKTCTYSTARSSPLQACSTFYSLTSRFNDSDHLKDPDLYSDKSDREGEQDHEESDPEGLEKSEESDSDTSERQDDSYIDMDPNEHLRETPYLEQSHEELGEVGD